MSDPNPSPKQSQHNNPGFRPQDADSLLNSLRQLRDFYAEAAKRGNAIVTCLV